MRHQERIANKIGYQLHIYIYTFTCMDMTLTMAIAVLKKKEKTNTTTATCIQFITIWVCSYINKRVSDICKCNYIHASINISISRCVDKKKIIEIIDKRIPAAYRYIHLHAWIWLWLWLFKYWKERKDQYNDGNMHTIYYYMSM